VIDTRIDVRNIGGGRHRAWWEHRRHVDRWFRSWQAEWRENCLWCPRRHERLYGPNPIAWVRRSVLWEYLAHPDSAASLPDKDSERVS